MSFKRLRAHFASYDQTVENVLNCFLAREVQNIMCRTFTCLPKFFPILYKIFLWANCFSKFEVNYNSWVKNRFQAEAEATLPLDSKNIVRQFLSEGVTAGGLVES